MLCRRLKEANDKGYVAREMLGHVQQELRKSRQCHTMNPHIMGMSHSPTPKRNLGATHRKKRGTRIWWCAPGLNDVGLTLRQWGNFVHSCCCF